MFHSWKSGDFVNIKQAVLCHFKNASQFSYNLTVNMGFFQLLSITENSLSQCFYSVRESRASQSPSSEIKQNWKMYNQRGTILLSLWQLHMCHLKMCFHWMNDYFTCLTSENENIFCVIWEFHRKFLKKYMMGKKIDRRKLCSFDIA